MEFSKPSRFLAEIDEQYVECDFNLRKPRGEQGGAVKVVGGSGDKNETAIDALRRRFDVRFQQKRADEPKRQPDPKLVTPVRSVEGLKRVPTTPVRDSAPIGDCAYAVGDRVEHPKFGVGEVRRVEAMATDHKVVVDFGTYGEKTLLAKFAKLNKL
jgi:DNA helicase-2/ATP-dependent DNA helicase PcrA